nr:uroporphyrinogen decarboxylase family protein [uncultured Holophaga sp.]
MRHEQLLAERRTRLEKTLRLERTDRTPVILMADTFLARMAGRTPADLCRGVEASSRIMAEGALALGPDLDGVNGAFAAGPFFPLMFMTRVQLPGRELPEGALWQLDEREVMTREDYDSILGRGWKAFMPAYLGERLGVDVEALAAERAHLPAALDRFHAQGHLVYGKLVAITVNEFLSGGRSMAKFMRDLYAMPDKVEEVLDIIQADTLAQLKAQILASPNPSPVVALSPARGASEFFNPKLWQRFVFPYIRRTVEMVSSLGLVTNIHCDSNWERDLDHFRVFEPGTVVFESDGATDMARIRERLGGRIALKGDVPANLLVLGTPEQVYRYCRELIESSGPGFILSCGCSCPPNAKPENVRAMIEAAIR